MSAFDDFEQEQLNREVKSASAAIGNDDLDRYALHENSAAPSSVIHVDDRNPDHDGDEGLLLNFGSGGLQSTARPLVTPPTSAETMIHLTPDPSDDLSSGRGEPFVNVTQGGSSYGIDDDDNDDVDINHQQYDHDHEQTGSSRPSAPPDSPTGLLRHPNPYQYTEEEEEIEEDNNDDDDEDDLDQFDPLKEQEKEDVRISPPANILYQEAAAEQDDDDDDEKYMSNKMADELHAEDIEHEYLNGDFVVPPPMHGDHRSSSPDASSPSAPAAAAEIKSEQDKKDSSCKQCPLNTVGAWFKADNLDPRVADLIYWRDVKKSGVVFGSGLVLLLSLTCFSLISVVAYLLLVVMAGTLSYRVYKTVLQAVQKSNDGHPFKAYLDFDLSLPSEKVHEVSEIAVKHLECVAQKLRRLFLVEDIVDSIKFTGIVWCVTYIGAWFNGLTLIILAFVALFTLPKVYETYKTEIDRYLNLATNQVQEVMNKVKAKIPIGKKQKEQ